MADLSSAIAYVTNEWEDQAKEAIAPGAIPDFLFYKKAGKKKALRNMLQANLCR